MNIYDVSIRIGSNHWQTVRVIASSAGEAARQAPSILYALVDAPISAMKVQRVTLVWEDK